MKIDLRDIGIFIIMVISLFILKECIHEMNYVDLLKNQRKHERLMKGIKE